jgi:parallel beta-helix repeat protein
MPTVVDNTQQSQGAGGAFYVSEGSGNDSGPGIPGVPYRTLTHALSVAVSGNIVHVMPGTYNSAGGEVFPLPLPDGVMLIGDISTHGSTTIISGGALLPPSPVVGSAIDAGSGSTISGFTITNPTNGFGLALQYSGVTVSNNTITGNSRLGLYIFNGSGGHFILNNVIKNNTGPGLIFRPPFPGQFSLVQGNTIGAARPRRTAMGSSMTTRAATWAAGRRAVWAEISSTAIRLPTSIYRLQYHTI